MSTRLFNNTVLTFGGSAVGGLVGLSYRIGGQWIDVTIPEDLYKVFELSTQPELTLQARFAGCHSLTDRTKGAIAIVFSNGFVGTLPGTWQVGQSDYNGDLDAPWKSSAEFRPTVA